MRKVEIKQNLHECNQQLTMKTRRFKKMWKELKEKLPKKAKYTEMGEEEEVTIADMNITPDMIYFTLIGENEFKVSCDSKLAGVILDSKGLLIDAPHLWTLLIPM